VVDETSMSRWGLSTVVAFVSTCSVACASGSAGDSSGGTDPPDGASGLDSTAAEGGFDAPGDTLGAATFDSAVVPADDAGVEAGPVEESGSEAGGRDSGTTPETGGNDAAGAPDAGADAGPSFNGGTFHLVNAATGFLADVYQGSKSSGTEVIQYHSDNGTNQQWTFVSSGDGSYLLFNKNSNLVLDITGPNVIQATASGSTSQNWVVSPGTTAGFYVFTSGGGAGALSTQGSSEGAQLLVQPANGTTTQEWQIAP
jgi:hypothetical protein